MRNHSAFIERVFSNWRLPFLVGVVFAISLPTLAWEIDLSRRRKEATAQDNKERTKSGADVGFFEKMVPQASESQEVVLLNTEHGFVPQGVHLKKGLKYKMHIVNVNEKEKNVSFVLDAFSKYIGTYYGQIKTIELDPKQEGVFAFQCPETAYEGRLIVTGESARRVLSSTEENAK